MDKYDHESFLIVENVELKFKIIKFEIIVKILLILVILLSLFSSFLCLFFIYLLISLSYKF